MTYNPSFPGPANTGGLTYFRIYGYNAQNSGVDAMLFIDNVTITDASPPCHPPSPRSS